MNPINHKQCLVDGLLELYNHKQLCDVTLMCEQMYYPCHRLVLAASSPYFRAMFTSQLQETQQDVIELHRVPYLALDFILSYMYTGAIEITSENAEDIFTTASLFQMMNVCSLCTDYMIKELHISNCIPFYQFASFHSCPSLKSESKSFVLGHFEELIDSEDLLQLSYDEFLELLEHDDMNVKEEEAVFDLLLRWIRFDEENRSQHFCKLFPHIRAVLLSDDYIENFVDTEMMVLENQFCKSLLNAAKMYKSVTLNSNDKLECAFPVKPRLGMYNKRMIVFIGGSQERDNRGLTCFDPKTKKNYYAIPPHISFDFKYRIDYHKAVVTEQNEIFFTGGIFYEDHHFESAGPAMREVKLYNPFSKSWISKAPMKESRCAHVSICHQGRIYALGGKSTYPYGGSLASAECYIPEEDSWFDISPMPFGLCHHTAVSYGKCIYVIGGCLYESHNSANIFEYNPQTDTWKIVEDLSLKVSRSESGGVIIGDEVFIIAGTNGTVKLSSVEIFNFATRKWRYGPDFPEDRKSMACVEYDGSVYACGGIRTLISRIHRAPRVVESRDLWKLDTNHMQWVKQAKLVQYANIHGCVVANINQKQVTESDFISSSG